MSALSEKQMKFAVDIALLIQYADRMGYGVTFGDAYRDKRVEYGHPRSLHRIRLAVDLNLFKKDEDGHWEYIKTSEGHKELGEFWESLGNTWGGRFSPTPDGNHYSCEHRGMK